MAVRLTLLWLLLACAPAHAHEARPAHLQVRGSGDGLLDIHWTRPVRNGRALGIHPVFPEHCRNGSAGTAFQVEGLLHESWQLDCGAAGLTGEAIAVSGLDGVISDVLLRLETAAGGEYMTVLDRDRPSFAVPDVPASVTGVGTYYLELGVLHILRGPDHLLFVLGLMLLVRGAWQLVKTITAFTLAHSISLAAAVLGLVNVPSSPVEAIIALSIAFLGCEILRPGTGDARLASPWGLASVFGLVHGLGFAGGLAEIGLPENDIPLALFMFNFGVELGQLLFIMMALALMKIATARPGWQWPGLERLAAYGVGSMGAFWLIQRVNGFYPG